MIYCKADFRYFKNAKFRLLKVGISMLILFIFNPVLAYKISWSELNFSPGDVDRIYPVYENDFYVKRTVGGSLNSQITINYYHSFELSATGKIKPLINNKVGTFQDCINLEGKFYMFIKRTERNEVSLYMQEYNTQIEPVGEAKKVASYIKPKKKSVSAFFITTSNDDKYFAIYYEIYQPKLKKTNYGYNVFSSTLEELDYKENVLPYEDDLGEITQIHLSNTGDFFLVLKEFELAKISKRRFSKTVKNYKVYQSSASGFAEFSLNMNGRIPRNISIATNNYGKLTLTGLYSEENQSGATGLFCVLIDYVAKIIESENYTELSEEFIKTGWSERDFEDEERRKEKGKKVEQVALFNYRLKENHIMKDGSVVGSMEEFRVDTTFSYDGRRNESLFAFFYNDIIAYKINPQGEFAWIQRIKKRQLSYNDFGYRSSYASFIDDENLCMIFNDNLNNYNDDGSYIPEAVNEVSYSKKSNLVAMVIVNLQNGEVERQPIFSRNEVEAIAVPKLFKFNPFDSTMILYTTVGNKERFGILSK